MHVDVGIQPGQERQETSRMVLNGGIEHPEYGNSAGDSLVDLKKKVEAALKKEVVAQDRIEPESGNYLSEGNDP